MSKVICDREDIIAIADAVRNKTGNSDEMTLGEIASGINGIEAGGSGGGSVGTCTVTIIVPASVCVFGYGTYSEYINSTGTDWTLINDNKTMPSTEGFGHVNPFMAKRIFTNLPIGSIFTFYYGGSELEGAEISGSIEFSLMTHTVSSSGKYTFAICKCNGDGEITIVI